MSYSDYLGKGISIRNKNESNGNWGGGYTGWLVGFTNNSISVFDLREWCDRNEEAESLKVPLILPVEGSITVLYNVNYFEVIEPLVISSYSKPMDNSSYTYFLKRDLDLQQTLNNVHSKKM